MRFFFSQFIKTPEFKALKAWVEDDGSSDEDSPEQGRTNPTLPPVQTITNSIASTMRFRLQSA